MIPDTLPWIIGLDDRLGMEWNNHIVKASDTDMITCFMASDGTLENTEGQNNAEYIVKACNLFPELVAKLEELVKAEWMVTHDWGGDRNKLLKEVEELLARAKEE